MDSLKKLTTILLISLIIFLGGCDLNDLNEDPRSFASPDNFYTTPSQMEGVFASSMANLWGFWVTAYDWSLIQCFPNTDQFDGGDLNIQQNHCSHLWQKHYANIADINFVINSINRGTLDSASQEQLDELMGQAKFLRAWNYFQIVRMFGSAPLFTEEHTDDYFNYELPFSTVEEIYNLIVSDFTEASNKLPDAWTSDQIGRPTSGAANALLAKAYLTMATAPLNQTQYYEDAAALAKQVIDSGRYMLVEDVNDVFSFETEQGPEMMWSFYSNYERPTISPQVWSEIRGWGDQTAQDVWVDAYPEQPRKHAYLELENDAGETWKELGVTAGINKYLYDSDEDFNAGRSIINMPIIRYADVLLIFAEAENMADGGPTQEAVNAINQVIDRANGHKMNPDYPLLTTNMTQQEFDDAVIRERNLELCFEYDRWFDIVRKRILEEVSRPEILSNFSENDYLFPIPDTEMRLNENAIQNPGY